MGADPDMDSVACFFITFPWLGYLARPQGKSMHLVLMRLDMLVMVGVCGSSHSLECRGKGKQGGKVGLGGEAGGGYDQDKMNKNKKIKIDYEKSML